MFYNLEAISISLFETRKIVLQISLLPPYFPAARTCTTLAKRQAHKGVHFIAGAGKLKKNNRFI